MTTDPHDEMLPPTYNPPVEDYDAYRYVETPHRNVFFDLFAAIGVLLFIIMLVLVFYIALA